MNGFSTLSFHKNSALVNPSEWENELESFVDPENPTKIPNCDCGQPANLKVCQTTEKGNYGKQYYVCANKKAEERCKYFCWFNDVDKPKPVTTFSAKPKTSIPAPKKRPYSPMNSDSDSNNVERSPKKIQVQVKPAKEHVFDDPNQLRMVALSLLQQRISEDNVCFALKNQLTEIQKEVSIIHATLDKIMNTKKQQPQQ
jgi:hypothetical protein